MKYYLFLTVAIQIALNADCLPFPAGQIVKYRVPSKYFNGPGETAQESSNSLYDLLTQIHYGGTSPTVTTNVDAILSEDVASVPESETSTENSTKESPEVIFVNSTVHWASNYFSVFIKATVDVTELHQQMDIIKVNGDSDKNSLQALIEKVVNDEIKKLAQETIGASEVIKLNSEPLLNVVSSTEPPLVDTTTIADESQTEFVATTFSSDGETTTSAPAVENEMIKLETITFDNTETSPTEQHRVEVSTTEVETTTSSLQPDESATDDGSISDSLLSAVGDLLSSILGLDSSLESEKTFTQTEDEIVGKTENAASADIALDATATSVDLQPFTTTDAPESEASSEIERGTQKFDETATPVGYEGERSGEEETVPLGISTVLSNDIQDKDLSEIDLKIENLASAQTSFATESPETVRDEPSESISVEPVAFEILSDGDKAASFEDSINRVMSLVKGTEGRLPSESAGNVVDSILIDKHMRDDVNDLDQIVYGTLKEIEANLGISRDAYEPIVHRNEDAIKNFEMEINVNPYDADNFMPNSAKAALQYKHDDDVVDF